MPSASFTDGLLGQTAGSGIARAIHDAFCRGGRLPDAAQAAAIDRLGSLVEALPAGRRSWWRGRARSAPGRWLFLWGGVGRGKTTLVDALAEAMPSGMVRRYHQHVFLDDFHRHLEFGPGANDGFAGTVRRLVGAARILVLDEFHAYDIADALILERAFSVLDGMGGTLLLTANHRPWHIWPETPSHAARARHFDPLVELLRRRCDFLEVDAARDYREVLASGRARRWFVGASVAGRTDGSVPTVFAFPQLCAGNFRHADYEAICRRAGHLRLDAVPVFGPADGDALRRLIWLVDAAWEALLPMTVTAAAEPEEIFAGIGDSLDSLLGKDLKRTLSRLLALVAI